MLRRFRGNGGGGGGERWVQEMSVKDGGAAMLHSFFKKGGGGEEGGGEAAVFGSDTGVFTVGFRAFRRFRAVWGLRIDMGGDRWRKERGDEG